MYIIPLIGGRVGCGVTQWSLLGPMLSAPENDFVAKSVRLEGKGAININVSINGQGKREEI
jgi:hypothetical protein